MRSLSRDLRDAEPSLLETSDAGEEDMERV